MKRGEAHRHAKRDRPLHRPLFIRELSADSLRGLRKDLKKQSKRYRKRLKRCQKEFSESAVHALRVQSRRLLSTIELLEHFLPADDLERIRHAFKCNLDIFDDLRDTQVQLLTIRKMRRTFPAARSFHAWLEKVEETAIRRARRDIRKITGARARKLISTARKDVKRHGKKSSSAAISRLLLAAVHRAHAKTIFLRNLIHPREPETIHRTRVAFKKFRYMYEILARHAPSLNKGIIPEMQHYQMMMGDIQDSVLLVAALDKFLPENQTGAEAASRLRDELLRRQHWLTRVYMARANQFRHFGK